MELSELLHAYFLTFLREGSYMRSCKVEISRIKRAPDPLNSKLHCALTCLVYILLNGLILFHVNAGLRELARCCFILRPT
jgi:hypothetical protein